MRTSLWRKHKGALRPYDDAAVEVCKRIKDGEVVRAGIRRPRSLKHNNWWHAFLTLLWEAQELYATKDDLHAALKCAIGHARTITLPDGRIILVPESTDFRMDQQRFHEYSEKAVKFTCEHIIPRMEESALRAEIEAMLAGGNGR